VEKEKKMRGGEGRRQIHLWYKTELNINSRGEVEERECATRREKKERIEERAETD